MSHRYFRLLSGVALAAGLAACGGSSPGQAVSWPQMAVAPSPSDRAIVAASPVARAVAGSAAGPDWKNLWRSLNADTANAAAGQYMLIQELETAIHGQLNSLLKISARR